MAWIERRVKRDGTVSYWIRDRRGNQQIVIAAGQTKSEATLRLEQYMIRRDLEKEGYDDEHEKIADEVFGARLKETDNGMA